MKNKTPYRKRLYAAVAVVLLLCFAISMVGMTTMNVPVVAKERTEQVNRLEKRTLRRLKAIETTHVSQEESLFLSAYELAQYAEDINQGGLGVYFSYEGEEIDNGKPYEDGNLVFLTYMDSSLDDDRDVVEEEQVKVMLSLDAYLSAEECKEMEKYYNVDEDTAVYVEGFYKGIEVVPTCIQVLKPRETAEETLWESPSQNKIRTDQGSEQAYTVCWEKTFAFDRTDTQLEQLPSYSLVKSESVFKKENQLTTAAKEICQDKGNVSKDGFVEVVRSGQKSLGNGISMKYCYMARPLQEVMQQLKMVYVSICIFYLVAATLLYFLMHVFFKKQDQWNWSQKMLTRAIAHELKTPISIIQGYCEGLQLQEDKERQREYLQTITEETKEMNRLVLDMLELSRFETGGYEMEPEEIELGELIHAVLGQYKTAYEEKQVTVIIDGPEEVFFTGDLSCMHKVISNLIGNAIKHAPSHGQVRVKMEQVKDKVILRIYNNGPEIEEKIRKHIWDGYHKPQKENKGKIRSTGLGLTIVKYMLDLHGFTYGCENKNPGVEFWVGIQL